MLTSILRKPIYYNKELHDYCLKSTNDSIKRIIEKNDEERKKKLICFDLQVKDINCDFKPKNEVFPFILFLSVSSFLFYFMSQNNK